MITSHYIPPQTIFNGNNYDPANQTALTAAGVWRIDSGVEAIGRLSAEENQALFERHGVLSREECSARQTVMFEQYIGEWLCGD